MNSYANIPVNHRFQVSSFLVSAILLLGMWMAGCSRSNEADTLELLANVPADAQLVGVININSAVESTGGKMKDSKIIDCSGLSTLIEGIIPPSEHKLAEWFLSEDNGLDNTSAVCFIRQGRSYLVTLIADPDMTSASLDKAFPGEWTEMGKTSAKGRIAMRDNRLWILPDTELTSVDMFTNLTGVESFRENPYAEKLSKSTDNVAVWSSIDAMLRASELSFSQQTLARMALGMCFNSPQYMTGGLNLGKNEISLSLGILDSDYKPSHCELAVSKIDVSSVSALGGNANILFAVAVSEKMVSQIMSMASSLGGQMPSIYASAIESLDGTIAFAASATPTGLNDLSSLPFKASVTTSGKNNARLLQTLEPLLGKAQINGNTFIFNSEGYGNGLTPVAEGAKAFEGAWLGLAAPYTLSDGKGKGNILLTLTPASGSISLNLKLKF